MLILETPCPPVPAPAVRRLLDATPSGNADAAANAGCLLYKEGDFAGAAKRFEDATHALGRQVRLALAGKGGGS
jgi:thioredoxin-like negative regulator of GroEL